MTFNLGILEVGRPPENLGKTFGDYPSMFESLLRDQGANWNYVSYPVMDGKLPQSVHSCDCWLITGSKHGVYDKLEWIEQLKEFLKDAYDQHVPIIGICFGHQILAEALGGKAEKSEKGWGCGVFTYYVLQSPQWMPEGVTSFSIEAYHQDQVVRLPEDGEVIASSDFCEFAAIDYNGRALSFQGHPEFGEDYSVALFKERRGVSLPEEIADHAIESSKAPTQSGQVAHMIVSFIQQAAVREKRHEV
ncbi:GMP synthase [glutamine-hydrolyzing] [Pseudovibrio axinellae]|uniref:GMP synthase [glutamine-hydrolyzing] n=1 Tax=Pseudovibrio axinellae TaxID=989403 RepID=A0A165T530_9HYPH|nr:gamma-glutamyl-gamma-aminobutyrate hydrolase family protein [Pseudovibrio axinellae]KZL05443.1 GMP synthase [glutamine-hydrolyzing] [Pseudovibrio axinellae]SEP98995.1 GMP synthase-Glutamine amidotransferase [Pseudovibrio axinellae]